ncbi:MAG TPA: hypothetical protein VFI11_13255 [Anaerolineales bacterium]|nr:hypothetical protein [Anaerolineales bacterium]
MLPEVFLSSPVATIAIFAAIFISDSLLTVYGARLYAEGANRIIVMEGSYELNPAYAADVDRFRAVTPRLLATVTLFSILIWLAWYVFVDRSWFPPAYTFLVGVVLLVQGPVHVRHFRNIATFRHANRGDGIGGRIEYGRRFAYRLSSIDLLSFAGLYAVLGLLAQSLFLLGGAFSTAMLALRSHQQAGKIPPPASGPVRRET